MLLQYQPGNSVLHRMDAITKMLWIVILGIFGFIISAPELVAILVAAVIITGLVLGRIGVARFVKGATFFWVLGAAAGMFQLFIRKGGETLLALGPLVITTQGVRFGLTFALRITLIALASLFYVWTTDPRKLVMAGIYMKVPYRIAYALFVALRFMPLVENEARVIREAQTVRGVELLEGKLKAARRYVIPLLASSLRKAQSTAIAMEARAFGALPTRTYTDVFRWSWQGGVLILAFLVLGLVLVVFALEIEGGLFQR